MAFLLKLAVGKFEKAVFNEFTSEMKRKLGRNARTCSTSPEQQIDSSKPLQTIQEVKQKLAKLMGVTGYKPIQESRSYLLEYLPKSQSELEPRSMQDSFTSALIPLSIDYDLQNRYITFLGNVRLGRLLEDLDIFAVLVAHKHIKNPRQKPELPTSHNIVTVLVDKIDFTSFKPTPTDDIRLSGHVSWVGSSSIEVIAWLEQMRDNKWHKLTHALFLMAARDATHTKAAFVNPLKPASENEMKIFREAESRKIKRKTQQDKSLLKVFPTDEEQNLIHELFIRTMAADEISLLNHTLPTGCAWMKDSKLSNVIFSQPENRNLHNKVFGGFLMRQAVELSWALAYLYNKHRPELRHISDIKFHKPVAVNSLIKMHAHVVYTNEKYVQITVHAESFEPNIGVHNTTNIFYFTFEFSEIVPTVLPLTYHEAMMYLDGKRHFENALSQPVADSNIGPISKL